MSRFIGNLDTRLLVDGVNVMLLADFGFQSDKYGTTITAKREFRTDGATIMRVLWTITGSPFTGKYRRAAVIHDWLCVNGGELGVDRATADGIFLEAMRCDGYDVIRSRIKWLCVRGYWLGIGKWLK